MTDSELRESNDITKLLLVWMDNSKRAQIAHYESANNFSRLHYWLGVPAVILSTAVGTSVFATLQKTVRPSIQIFIGMISVLAGILTGLQTFLNFSERASKHHSAASEYEAVKRQIAEILAIQSVHSEDILQQISQIRERMDGAGKNAPSIPSKIWNIACKKVPFSKEIFPK